MDEVLQFANGPIDHALVIITDRPAARGRGRWIDEEERSLWTIGRLSARDRNLIGLTQYKDRVTASIHRSKIRHIFPIIGMLGDEA